MATALQAGHFEVEVSHLSGQNGVTAKIKGAMQDVARQFVYIGFLLWEVKHYQYFYELNYGSVYEYAEMELGFKRSSTKNFIAICEEFCRKSDFGTNVPTMHLDSRWNDFRYSQLTEMLSMSAKQREEAKPNMTVKQLRQLKKDENVYCTINEDTGKLERVVEHHPQSETTGQTSGQAPAAEKDHKMHDASWWVPDEFDRSRKLVKRTDNPYHLWDVGYYNGSKGTWHDQDGNEIQVSHWTEFDEMTHGQTSGQKVQPKATPVNNHWKELPPDVVKAIVKAAGLHWNPKTCYNITIEKHIG